MVKTALIIGAHVEEIEAEMPLLPLCLSQAGWRVVILNPVGGWNWRRLRTMTPAQLEKFKRSCVRAGTILGARKLILDYDIGALPGAGHAMLRDMAAIIQATAPRLVFIPWALDTHHDHRHLAQICFRLLHGSAYLTLLDGMTPARPAPEVWAYPAGISQSYDFWPDAVVAGDAAMFKTVTRACAAFYGLDASKIRSFTDNVKRKTQFWSVYAGGRPAEAVKFVGPSFPLAGTVLRQALGKRVFAVDAGPILCAKFYLTAAG